MQIQQLRQATEADHAAVEGAMALMDPHLTVSGYRAGLERMYPLICAWETLAESTAPVESLPFVKARARRTLLAADILALNGYVDPVPDVVLPAFASRSEFLGALYVMEGSRLGGQFIGRHVEAALGPEGTRATAYLRGFGEKTGSNWKELLSLLASDIPDCDGELTIAAAKEMFRAFGAWMTHTKQLPQTRSTASVGESHHG